MPTRQPTRLSPRQRPACRPQRHIQRLFREEGKHRARPGRGRPSRSQERGFAMRGFSAHATSIRQPRPRRYVSPRTMRLLRFLGFRYSMSRDAYILRLVGGRFGPVLRPHNEPQPAVEAAPAPPPEPANEPWGEPTFTADDAP